MRKTFNYKAGFWILFSLVIVLAIFIFSLLGSRQRVKKVAPKKVSPKAAIPAKGKIAIVIDDFGYNLNNLPLLKTIKQPITVSVLPHLSYSQTMAENLNALGFEVILHLPLEPKERYRLEKDTILTGMSDETIKAVTNRALDGIPFIRGVSNHMGSKATQDRRTMSIVFQELKKRRLYFLDSLVTGKSVCRNIAKETGIAFARRDIFLDNEPDTAYIKGQLNKLKARAQRLGEAVGIGHDRRQTIEVLKEVIPEFKRQGYKFVYVSDLAR